MKPEESKDRVNTMRARRSRMRWPGRGRQCRKRSERPRPPLRSHLAPPRFREILYFDRARRDRRKREADIVRTVGG